LRRLDQIADDGVCRSERLGTAECGQAAQTADVSNAVVPVTSMSVSSAGPSSSSTLSSRRLPADGVCVHGVCLGRGALSDQDESEPWKMLKHASSPTAGRSPRIPSTTFKTTVDPPEVEGTADST